MRRDVLEARRSPWLMIQLLVLCCGLRHSSKRFCAGDSADESDEGFVLPGLPPCLPLGMHVPDALNVALCMVKV